MKHERDEKMTGTLTDKLSNSEMRTKEANVVVISIYTFIHTHT